MPPRGHSIVHSGRHRRGHQQHQQQPRQTSPGHQPETLEQTIERLWLPIQAECVAAGTLFSLSAAQLITLEQALCAAVEQHHKAQAGPSAAFSVVCSPATYSATANLLVLAAFSLPAVPLQDLSCLKLFQIVFQLFELLTPRTFGTLTQLSVESKNNLAANLVARLQFPQLTALLLSRAPQHQPTEQAVGAMIPAADASTSSGQEQATGPAAAAGEGSAGHGLQDAALIMASVSYPIMDMLSATMSPATAQPVLRSLALSQVLDYMARSLMEAAGSRQAAAGSLTLNMADDCTHKLDQFLWHLHKIVVNATQPSSSGGSGDPDPRRSAEATALAAHQGVLERLGLTCYDRPLVRRVLAAPGVQYWAASRMVQALSAVDGGPSWGMPEQPLPLPDIQQWRLLAPRATAEERSMAFIVAAANVLLPGLCQHMRQHEGDTNSGSGAATRSPVQPSGTYRIAMRALEWAVPAQHDTPQAASPSRQGADARAVTGPVPLPWRVRASPYALHVTRQALQLAMVAALAGPPEAAEARLLALLPHAVGALAGECKEEGEDGQRTGMPIDNRAPAASMAAGIVNETIVRSLRAMAAAPVCGVLPAMQAAMVWLTAEHEQQVAASRLQEVLFALLHNCLGKWVTSETPAVRMQLAALLASTRSVGVRSWQAMQFSGRPTQQMGQVCVDLGLCLTNTIEECIGMLVDSAEYLASPHARQLGVFMLVQLAPLLSRFALWALATSTSSEMLNAAFLAFLLPLLSVIGMAAGTCSHYRTAVVQARQQERRQPAAGGSDMHSSCGSSGSGAADSSSAGCRGNTVQVEAPEAQAALALLASWRRFLLRDLRVLDALGLMLQAATTGVVSTVGTQQLLDTLQAVCHALPRDVQRHLEAGRRQMPLSWQQAAKQYLAADQADRCVATQAAGCGLAWLRVDARTRALLGPGRFNRPELLAALEGSGPLALGPMPVQQEHATVPPYTPCQVAALLPTCDNPMCTTQACYLAAGRGGPLPVLRPCPKCGQARYCSKGCQKAHWDAYHKAECGQGWWDASCC